MMSLRGIGKQGHSPSKGLEVRGCLAQQVLWQYSRLEPHVSGKMTALRGQLADEQTERALRVKSRGGEEAQCQAQGSGAAALSALSLPVPGDPGCDAVPGLVARAKRKT
jgi:hypothetical protein